MLIPTHCQTCGEPIGHLYSKYLKLVQEFSKSSKDDKYTPEFKARQELIDKDGLDGRRQCCLYALLVNHDITDSVI